MATVTDRNTGRTYTGRTLAEALDNFSRATASVGGDVEPGTGNRSTGGQPTPRGDGTVANPGSGIHQGSSNSPGFETPTRGPITPGTGNPPRVAGDPTPRPSLQPPVVTPPVVGTVPRAPTPEEIAAMRENSNRVQLSLFIGSPGTPEHLGALVEGLMAINSWTSEQAMSFIQSNPSVVSHAQRGGSLPQYDRPAGPPSPNVADQQAEIRARTAELLITQFLASPGGNADFANLRNQLFNTFSDVGWSDAQVMDFLRQDQEVWNHAQQGGAVSPPVVEPPRVVDPPAVPPVEEIPDIPPPPPPPPPPAVEPPVVDPPVVDPPLYDQPAGPPVDQRDTANTLFEDPLLRELFPQGIDFSRLAPSEFRTIAGAGQEALRQNVPGLSGMSPFMQNILQSRIGDATDLFGIGTALGRYGQAGVADDEIQLGGQSLQRLAEQNAVQSLVGPLTSNSFSRVLEAARQGLQTGDQQSAAIMAALGVGSGGNAATDFRGISGLVNSRNSLLPPGIASIFQAAINADRNQFLGGRSSAEISPVDYLTHLQRRGLI